MEEHDQERVLKKPGIHFLTCLIWLIPAFVTNILKFYVTKKYINFQKPI